ncbi:MAG TPA: hypothetical protein VMV53_00625 [Acidimicrobiales bacterium]|nr:hypothetical protein [Acidimicrobiales bacterium]
MTSPAHPSAKGPLPGPHGPGPRKPVQPPRPTTPKDNASVSLCIHAPAFVGLSNAQETRATIALATLLGSVLVPGQRIDVIVEPSDVTVSTHD